MFINLIRILLLLLVMQSCAEHAPDINNNKSKYLQNISLRPDIPVIAMLTLPCKAGSSENYCQDPKYKSFFPATYAKWLAGSGAQIVPVMYSESDDFFNKILPSVNGILLTGGHFNDLYIKRVRKIIDWVLEQNRFGNHVPLWGTCLGFQFIALALMKDSEAHFTNRRIKTEPYISHLAMPNLKPGRIFDDKSFPGARKIMKKLQQKPLTYHQHHYGIAKSSFDSDRRLSSVLEILATNTDVKGKEFVSIFQGVKFPIYGVQFHPEKTGFEPLIADIHSNEHHLVSKHFAQFFVEEARKHSTKNPPSDDLANYLLQNFDLMPHPGPFSEIYAFER